VGRRGSATAAKTLREGQWRSIIWRKGREKEKGAFPRQKATARILLEEERDVNSEKIVILSPFCRKRVKGEEGETYFAEGFG